MKKSSIIILSSLIVMMMAFSAFLIWLLYADRTVQEEQQQPAEIQIAVRTAEISETQAQVEGLDSLDGPFEVRNCLTGKSNSLERKDGFLTLTDEKGKVVWRIPFDTPLCARVCSIDYYHNGKIQFLFISGGRFYLLDRLGRLVDDCSAKLAKDVLIGPDVYDFNGNGKYIAIVLNSDNTIDMYNLRGEKPEKWLGISPVAKVLSLPSYSETDGKSFWTIPTTDGDKVYPFYGGEPVR